jgi:hypothetical protein
MRRSLSLALACGALLAACVGDPSPAPPVTVGGTPTPPGASPTGPAPVAPPQATQPTAQGTALAKGHPRLWITPEDLPRLRGWVTLANPLWRDGLAVAVKQAVATYDKEFFPGGQESPSWPDPGNDNWTQKATEAYAELFAFMSLVDPRPEVRAKHAERARRLLMHAIREASKGVDNDPQNPAPFRARALAVYNRANWWGEGWGLTVDWIYGALDASDKALIRKVFLRWADENVNAATSMQEHPQPVGLVNDPRLLADRERLRTAANNYYTGHMRHLTLMAASFDEADDPPIDPSAPAGRLGNTLRSYLDDAIGAWLYQQYAEYEDPAVSAAKLHVPADRIGDASGGLSPEGLLYGMHIAMLHEALLALHTAGYRDPARFGPQIQLIDSRYWDRRIEGFLQSIAPAPEVVPSLAYMGPVYQAAGYGDALRAWVTVEQAQPFMSIGLYAQRTGNAAQLAKARWIAASAVEGGPSKLADHVAHIWGEAKVTQALLYFMLFDPAAPLPPDPRPSLPLTFFDRSIGRLITRTGWGPDASSFDYKCSYNTIGHQNGDCNLFELARKGEWLVKARLGYSNDQVSVVSDYANTLAVQNAVTSGAAKPRDLQWFEETTWKRGGQFLLHQNAGDPRVVTSVGRGFAYAFGDATPLYNRPRSRPDASAVDVTHVSRSIAWLQPDRVVVYDRAATKSAGLFKRWNLTLLDEPHVAGQLATATTPRGQQIFVELLAPAGATMTAMPAEAFNKVAEGDPTRFRLLVEDPKNPSEVRFLHVIQGADAGAQRAPVKRIQSKGGTAFEGASVGAAAAMFPVDPSAPFTGVTYEVPAEVTAQLVGGLAPRGGYDVTIKRAGNAAEVSVAPGSAYHADEAGVLAIGGFAAVKAP